MAAGTRAYSIGFQDGRFYAHGWHIMGEMGGIWAPPLKLADGVWFGVEDEWVGPARRFTSGRGYTRFTLPPAQGLNLRRTDFVPDGRRAALFGLELGQPRDDAQDRHGQGRRPLRAHGRLPVDRQQGPPHRRRQPQDGAAYATARSSSATARSEPHDGARRLDRAAISGETGPGFRGPQPGTACKDGDQVAPSACDDGPHGKGAGGQLRYRVTVAAATARRCGSPSPPTAAELAATLKPDPDAQLAAKIDARIALAARSRVDLPGDRAAAGGDRLGQAEPRRPHADRERPADPLRRQGGATPRRSRRSTARRSSAPATPTTRGCSPPTASTRRSRASRSASSSRSRRTCSRSRDVSDALNDRSGKIAHEIVTDGSVYFGANDDPGNTDESVKFPSAVALVWRWTGDDRFRDELYDLSRRALRHVTGTLDADKDGWPEGLGNVEREGMGEEKLDNAVYLIRGLYDLADMARSRGDGETSSGRTASPTGCASASTRTWWDQDSTQYADSLAGDAASSSSTGSASRRWKPSWPPALRSPPPSTPPQRSPSARATASAARAVQSRPVPHRLRRRPGGQGRAHDVLAQHGDQGRRRGQLRARRAAPLHERQRRPGSPTSSPARCPRSSPRRTSATPTPTTATSIAAGRAARCSCRPGATTARPGR